MPKPKKHKKHVFEHTFQRSECKIRFLFCFFCTKYQSFNQNLANCYSFTHPKKLYVDVESTICPMWKWSFFTIFRNTASLSIFAKNVRTNNFQSTKLHFLYSSNIVQSKKNQKKIISFSRRLPDNVILRGLLFSTSWLQAIMLQNIKL